MPLEPRPSALPQPSDRDVDSGFLFTEILADLPEFAPRYLELVAACDDDPGEPLVLAELAEFVAGRLAALTAEEATVARAIGLVEGLIDARRGDEVDCEPVTYAFFDSFTVEDRARLARWLGPHSLRLLESLEVAEAEHHP